MSNLNESDLKTLYFSFIDYRDAACNGNAIMSIKDFYNKYGIFGVTDE